jgi:hypothetical protein
LNSSLIYIPKISWGKLSFTFSLNLQDLGVPGQEIS